MDLSKIGQKIPCESFEDNSVLPTKKRKLQESSSLCASSKKVKNSKNDNNATMDLMQIEKIIRSLPKNSSCLIKSCSQSDSILKCPKCDNIYRQLKLGSMHYSVCKNFKLVKNKKASVSPNLLVLVCNLCYSAFDGLTKLSKHLKVCQVRKSSNVSPESATYRKKYKCKKCCYECFSPFKFKDHSCNKIIEHMQLCSIKIPTLDITQSTKSNLQCFECTRCCRFFLNINSFNNHMKIAHNLEVPATEGLKNLTVHNRFCPPSQSIINSVPMTKENSVVPCVDLVSDTTAVQEVLQLLENEDINDLQEDGQNLSVNFDSNIQETGSVNTSSGQTNSSNVQTSGCPARPYNKIEFTTIQSVGSVEISKSKISPDSERASCSVRMFSDESNSGSIKGTRSVKMFKNQINFRNIQASRSDKVSNCPLNKEGKGCDEAPESIKTYFKNFGASGSVTMSNDLTVSNKTLSSKNMKPLQDSKTGNLKTAECSEVFEGSYSEKETCRCQGLPGEVIETCEDCFIKSIYRSLNQVTDPNLSNSGEKQWFIANLNTDMAPKETLVSGTQIPAQNQATDSGSVCSLSASVELSIPFTKSCSEDNLDFSQGSIRELIACRQKNFDRAILQLDEKKPESVVNNGILTGIDEQDCPVSESILDLSNLLTCDRIYESDEDYYNCVSKRLQYVTRKLVVQRGKKKESSAECLRIDSSKRWIAKELKNNKLEINQITVKHLGTSWGPFDADAHSVIRSHNGENVLSYICNHCFMEFNLDTLRGHLCSRFGRPINNEIKIVYARDNLL